MAESENTNDKSRTLILNAFGGHDKIKVVEKPRQKPGAGQVLVTIEACGINFAELMMRQGLYSSGKQTLKPPCELGWEGAGVVAELGEGVTTFQVCTGLFVRFVSEGGRGSGRGMDVATPGSGCRGKCPLWRRSVISDRLVSSCAG